MLRSMTGYGESEVATDGHTINCEARSVNGRFLNVSVRLPEPFQYLEHDIRNLVRTKLTRGSVSVGIKVEVTGPETYTLNEGLLRHYLSMLSGIRDSVSTRKETDPTALLSLPGVVERVVPGSSAQTRQAILSAVEKALNLMAKMREKEGKSLARDLRQRLATIKKHTDRIEKRSRATVEERRKTLKRRMEEFLTEYDRQRLNLEMLVQIDKVDIHEELVRLKGHLAHFKEIFKEPPPIGSKLTYLTQEMHREANTLSVKSMDRHISLSIVLIKEELERIREQLQNVE